MQAKENFAALIDNQIPLLAQNADLMLWLQTALLLTQRQLNTLCVEIERFSYQTEMKRVFAVVKKVLPGLYRPSTAEQLILRLCD